MLLELLGSDDCLHDFGGVVYLAVLDDLESVVDHASEGTFALWVASEGAASQETNQEVFKHVQFGEFRVIGQVSVLSERGLAWFGLALLLEGPLAMNS